MNKYYVYVLIDSLTHMPIYIGKCTKTRCNSHLRNIINQKHPNEHLQRKGNKIINNGGTIISRVLYVDSERDAFDYEKSWIKYARQMKYPICNMTDGGSGGNVYQYLSEDRLNDIRSKLSKANKGKIIDDEYRKKLSDANKGQIPWSKGRKRPEHSIAMRGMKRSPEFCEKMKQLWIKRKAAGWTFPEDAKIQISNTKLGKRIQLSE